MDDSDVMIISPSPSPSKNITIISRASTQEDEIKSLLEILGPDNAKNDYDFLFPKRKRREGIPLSKRAYVKLFRPYCNTIKVKTEMNEDYLKENEITATGKVRIDKIKEKEEKQKEDEEIIKEISNYLSKLKRIDLDKDITKLFNLNDFVFENVLEQNKDNLSIQDIILPIVKVAAGSLKNYDAAENFQNREKLSILTKTILLHKIRNPKNTVRNIFPIFNVVAESNSEIIVEHIFLPLFKEDLQIHKTYLNFIDLRSFIKGALEWMEKDNSDLTENRIQSLMAYFEKQELLDPNDSELIFKTLERTLCHKSNDKKLSSFFLFLIKRFHNSLGESELEKFIMLNKTYKCIFQNCIQDLLQIRLNQFKK